MTTELQRVAWHLHVSDIRRMADEAADALQREMSAFTSVVDYAELSENMRVIMGMRAAIATLENLAIQLA